MKKNTKGFTLVELLAVIVILAIIALIATPMILNVIDEAKKGAAQSSAYGYIDAVEKSLLENMVSSQSVVTLSGTYTVDASGNLVDASSNVISVNVKGDKPSENGTLVYSNGKLTSGSLTVNGYTFTANSNGSLAISK